MNIVFATQNEHKMTEIREILADLKVTIKSMAQANIDIDIVEDGSTFEENALIKARAVAKYTDAVVLADDSGLEIDYLNKEPGIYSARYMGEDTSYLIKNQAILERLEGVEKNQRTARFVCAIAAVFPDGEEIIRRGIIEGYIGQKASGENGFGYDPIFYIEPINCSTAQLTQEEKNRLSHRGNALRMIKKDLIHRL